jgi:hypothetical protein
MVQAVSPLPAVQKDYSASTSGVTTAFIIVFRNPGHQVQQLLLQLLIATVSLPTPNQIVFSKQYLIYDSESGRAEGPRHGIVPYIYTQLQV